MSGPQGSDPTQPQQPQGEDQQSTGEDQTAQVSPWQQQPSGEQTWQAPSGEQPTWHAPAYTPTEYPQYQQPPAQFYPPSGSFPQPPAYPQQEHYGAQTGQFGAQATQYGPQPGQYGQPAQYGQPGQFGQYPPGQFPPPGQPGQYPPGQYPPPGQPGAYGQAPGSKRSRTVIATVIGVFAAILVAVILVLGFWQPGFFVTTKLDVSKAQAGVQKILTDNTNGYGAKNVKDVKCNNGQNPTVKKGGSFDCDVSIDGTKRQVTVTFQDNKGTYEVGRPK
jgi:Domain of unknown function (DUF4333)